MLHIQGSVPLFCPYLRPRSERDIRAKSDGSAGISDIFISTITNIGVTLSQRRAFRCDQKTRAVGYILAGFPCFPKAGLVRLCHIRPCV